MLSPESLLAALRHRRSFGLKELEPRRPVAREQLEQILEAANWAPSHGQTEPWRFVVFQGPALERLSEAFGSAYRAITPPAKHDDASEQKQRDKALMAPVWIAIGMAPDPKRPEWEELAAVACAVQNAHLMASALGLAAKWTSSAVATSEHVAALIGLPAPQRLLGFLYVGHPAKPWPEGSRQSLEGKVRWEDTP